MKKTTSFLVIFAVAALVLASNVMAFEVSGTGELNMGTPAMAPIGLSPKVFGVYFTDGVAAGDAQWFAIGTAHPGGTEMYATAQNLTNTFKKTFTPGTTIDAALFALPTGANSASEWSENSWRP